MLIGRCDAPFGECVTQVADPALGDRVDGLALDQHALGLGEQLVAPADREQLRVEGEAAEQLVQHAGAEDARVEGDRRCGCGHSAGAPSASSSAAQASVRLRPRSRRCSNASTEDSGIFQ
jgi:hypothetical protein